MNAGIRAALMYGGSVSLPQLAAGGLLYDPAVTSSIDMDGSNRIASIGNLTALANAAATQSSVGNKPTWEATGLNGQPGIRFTAASTQYFEIGAGAYPLTNGIAGITVIEVAQRVSLTGANQIIFGVSQGALASANRLIVYETNGAQRALIAARVDGDTGISAGPVGMDATPHINVRNVNYQSATAQWWQDGALLQSSAINLGAGGAGLVSATNSLRMRWGVNLGLTPITPMDRRVGLLLIVPRIMTTAELAAAHKLLSARFSIPLAA